MRFKDAVQKSLAIIEGLVLQIGKDAKETREMSDNVTTRLEVIAADVRQLTAAVGPIVDWVRASPQRIADAIAAAQAAAPLTPEQQAAFDELHAAVTTDTQQLIDALPASAQGTTTTP